MSFEDFISSINEEELKRLNEEFYRRQNQIPIYQYSRIRFNELKKLVNIKRKIEHSVFDDWFNYKFELDNLLELFLQTLIDENIDLIENYSEEDLKIKFLAPILNRVQFKSIENEFRDFYELPMRYETDKFIFNGTADFVVSKGLFESEKPYFFIQEFKKGQADGFPEPQLLAELITAVELNAQSSMRGAYIRGSIWHFVILERIEKHNYRYFVSGNFDSTRVEDLFKIYKNLMFIKSEIMAQI